MARHLVLLFDETWNDPPRNTNVPQFRERLIESPNQELKYIDGVGTLAFIPLAWMQQKAQAAILRHLPTVISANEGLLRR
jgi:hypothetical protein